MCIISIFEQIRGPSIIEGDRFINFRGSNEDDDQDMAQQYETKIELFQFDQQMEDQQRKNNQLVCDHAKQELSL